MGIALNVYIALSNMAILTMLILSIHEHRIPCGYYVKGNKPDKKVQELYGYTYMWDIKKATNEQTFFKKPRYNRMVVTRREGS